MALLDDVRTYETSETCQCDDCKGACKFKPGWFLPDQIPRLAELMDLTEQELFDKYLMVDFIANDDLSIDAVFDDAIFILSPAVLHAHDKQFSYDPRGQCVFYDNGCTIHHLEKPWECQIYHHSSDRREQIKKHQSIGVVWNTPDQQEKIEKLLGYAPTEPERPFLRVWL